MQTVRFAFEAVDRLSKPLVVMGGNLSALDKQLRTVDKSSKGLDGASKIERFKSAQDAAAKTRALELSGLKQVSEARNKQGQKLQDELLLTASHALKVAKAFAVLGAAVGGAAAMGGKFALDAARFKQDTSFALRFALGSQKAAQGAVDDVARIANILGVSTADAMDKFRELNKAGFDSRESQILLQFAADLKAVNRGNDVAISSIAEPLMALKNGEGLTISSFKALEEAGMRRQEVYERLAAGLNLKFTKGDDKGTKAKVDQALAGIQRGQKAVDMFSKLTLSAMGEDKLGKLAKEFQDTTITGSLDKIQAKWEALMLSINTGEAGKALVGILQKVAAAFDPATASGQRLRETFDRILGTVTKMLGQVDGHWLARGFESAADVIDEMLPNLEALGGGLLDGLKGAGAAVMEIVKGAKGADGGPPRDMAAAFREIGQAVGFAVVGIGALAAFLGYVNAKILSVVAVVQGSGGSIGVALIDGMINGLEGAKNRLIERVGALANLLPDTVRKLLEVRSPSRVMARLGTHTAEGFAEGVDRGAPQVQEASRGMVEAAQGGASGSAGPSQGASARPPVILPPGFVQITINGPADVDAIEARIRAGLIAAFREMGLELGAAT